MSSERHPIEGLYLVTDEPPPGAVDAWVDDLVALLPAGVSVLQLRDKYGVVGHGDGRRLATACREAGVPLIVNDDPELADAIGADGVHLGRDDASIAEARRRLGPGTIIGVSCYASLSRARRAAAQGADYVAFGSCFPSPTKPTARRVPLEVLHAARQALKLPIVAIGGITLANLRPLLAAGVDAVAVVSAVFAAPDRVDAVRRLAVALRADAAGDIGC